MKNSKKSFVNSTFGKVTLTLANEGVVLTQDGRTDAIALDPEGMEKLAKALLAVKKNHYPPQNKSSPSSTQPTVPLLQSPPASYMEQQKAHHSKAYAAWTPEEETTLKDLYRSGKTVTEIAQVLKRNTGAIKSRLKKLKLI